MSFDPGGFSISTAERDGRTVVLIRGELDLATAPDLEKVVHEHLDAGGEVVVDLRELQFMDSSGLRVLVRAHAAVGGEKRFLIVRPPPGGPIAKILAIAGVESQLDVVDDA
jgi:anti-sigma B factor antagonist